MQRVEKSMDQQANAYSLFQTAITLEGQVRVRTEELKSALSRLERTNDELMTARDASERANRFKTRFFTAVGHDLLQPLHAARLSASALAEPNGSLNLRRLADRIEHALTTIDELLKSILDISKLEAGVITPSLRPVALDEIFASLAVDIEPLARLKNLSLTWRPNGWAVISDPLMLRRSLQNLLANAVQYTQKGGVKLAARRRGADVRIEVWDTGPGVPPAERQTIFEEFQRGRAIERPASGGFGLGLSIVQRMAEALGHPFDMCSRVGHGTRFSISAPFAGMAEARAAQSAPASAAFSYGLGGAKVAVLDNDTYVLEAMQSLLESWGCEVRLLQSVSDLDGLIESRLPARHPARRLSSRRGRLRSHRRCQSALGHGGRRRCRHRHHGGPFAERLRRGAVCGLRAALEAGQTGRAAGAHAPSHVESARGAAALRTPGSLSRDGSRPRASGRG